MVQRVWSDHESEWLCNTSVLRHDRGQGYRMRYVEGAGMVVERVVR